MNRKTPARRSGRQPKQDRSRTSLRRLLETAESMLASDGYAQFTLQALSKRAKVSIGSIYNLFESKQALVRDLQVRFLERVERVHAQVINDLRRNNLPLKRLVPTAVRDYGEYLRDHAELLRVFMEIAPSDPIVSANGKKYAAQAMKDFELLLLDRRDDIRHPDPEHAVARSYTVMYAVIGRYLGLGSNPEAADPVDWNSLIDDISLMILQFLRAVPEVSVSSRTTRAK